MYEFLQVFLELFAEKLQEVQMFRGGRHSTRRSARVQSALIVFHRFMCKTDVTNAAPH